MTAQLRPATPSDAVSIAKLRLRSWRFAYANVASEDVLASLNLDDEATRWTRRLGNLKDRACDVATLDGDLCGFIHYGPAIGTASSLFEIYSLHVASEVHGRGIGRMLMRRAVSQLARRAESLPVVLWVVQQNQRARAFYERLGFAPEPRRKTTRYGEHDVVEVRYCLTELGGDADGRTPDTLTVPDRRSSQ